MTPLLPALLLAQAIGCGTYGATPSSPNGCTVNGVYLQEVNGQIIRQDPVFPAPQQQQRWENSSPPYYSPGM